MDSIEKMIKYINYEGAFHSLTNHMNSQDSGKETVS